MNEIELKILIGMHRNVNNMDRNTGRIVSKRNLTISQFAVLEALYNKGDMNIGTVREKVLSSIGTIPVVITNLEKRGYIIRKADANDRRVSILSITKKGEEVIQELMPENTSMILDYMKTLTEEEKEKLLEILKKLGDR